MEYPDRVITDFLDLLDDYIQEKINDSKPDADSETSGFQAYALKEAMQEKLNLLFGVK